jgi:hypothetical protein
MSLMFTKESPISCLYILEYKQLCLVKYYVLITEL